MMELHVVQGDIAQQQVDCIVVNLFAGVTEPGGATGAVDSALNGAIRGLIAGGDFGGAAGSTALLYTHGQLPAPRVLVVGLGAAEKFDLHAARKAAGVAAQALAKVKGVKSFATIVHGSGIGGLEITPAAQALAEGTLLALYRAPQYRREDRAPALEQCVVVEFDADKTAAVDVGVQMGLAIAKGVFTARDLASEPGNILYPVEFARRAEALAE
ncbi:MAG: M17 family peptidase N-terminal domain-containing protein, partial [Litorilinea sp.]